MFGDSKKKRLQGRLSDHGESGVGAFSEKQRSRGSRDWTEEDSGASKTWKCFLVCSDIAGQLRVQCLFVCRLWLLFLNWSVAPNCKGRSTANARHLSQGASVHSIFLQSHRRLRSPRKLSTRPREDAFFDGRLQRCSSLYVRASLVRKGAAARGRAVACFLWIGLKGRHAV